MQETGTVFLAGVYIRLSREDGDKEESDSVGNQRRLLTDYIRTQTDLQFGGEYVDDGYTGTDFRRPAFSRMIRDIENGRINCVVVKDLSRFGRDYIDTGRYLERYFPEKGVRFIAVSEQIDSLKQAYDMLLPVRNIFNEQYARDISGKVQAAVRTKQKAGEFIGAFACYGYRKSPENKNRLQVDDYAAGIVQRIFGLYIRGCSKQEIAGILNQEGVLCPAEYKRVLGLSYYNPNRQEKACWTYASVNSILHREIYVGNMVQGTKHQCLRGRQKNVEPDKWIIVKNTHEPVIDRATWEKAQELLRRRMRRPAEKAERNPFAGFVVCGDCGRSMVRNSWQRSDGSRVDVLYCGTYKRYGKEFCSAHALPCKDLEEIIKRDFNTLLEKTENLKEIVRESLRAPALTGKVREDPSGTERELHRIRRLKQSLYEDYRDNLITKEEFCACQKDYREREALYQKKLEAQKEREQSRKREQENDPWLRQICGKGQAEAPDRDMIAEMVHEIRVYENRRIRIIYNFPPGML